MIWLSLLSTFLFVFLCSSRCRHIFQTISLDWLLPSRLQVDYFMNFLVDSLDILIWCLLWSIFIPSRLPSRLESRLPCPCGCYFQVAFRVDYFMNITSGDSFGVFSLQVDFRVALRVDYRVDFLVAFESRLRWQIQTPTNEKSHHLLCK